MKWAGVLANQSRLAIVEVPLVGYTLRLEGDALQPCFGVSSLRRGDRMIRTVVIAAMLAVMTPAWAEEDDAIETLTLEKARGPAKHEECLSLDGGCELTRPEMSQGNRPGNFCSTTGCLALPREESANG